MNSKTRARVKRDHNPKEHQPVGGMRAPTVPIYVQTYGCTLNQSDSEVMKGYLRDAGYCIVSNANDAALVVINTCAVKDPCEKKFYSSIEKYRHFKKIMVSGCIAQVDSEKLKGITTIGINQLDKVCFAVEETLKGNVIQIVAREKGKKRLCLPKIRKNNLIEIIPLCQGCLGECTFCKTRHARGKLESYPAQQIITQFREALKEGIYEFWLTAQDIGAYGKDTGSSLLELIRRMLQVRADFRLRLGMINPDFVHEQTYALIELYRDPRVFKFIHMPVQSGSDRILSLMKRKYTAEQVRRCLKTFKSKLPMLTVATDIIAGFPTETEEDFYKSIELIKEFRIPVVNVSKFYPRPGTPAAIMKKLPTKIVKERSTRLVRVCEENSDSYIWKNWKGIVYVDEKGKENTMVGRNDWYKPVVIKKARLGQKMSVKITEVRTHYLIGEQI